MHRPLQEQTARAKMIYRADIFISLCRAGHCQNVQKKEVVTITFSLKYKHKKAGLCLISISQSKKK